MHIYNKRKSVRIYVIFLHFVFYNIHSMPLYWVYNNGYYRNATQTNNFLLIAYIHYCYVILYCYTIDILIIDLSEYMHSIAFYIIRYTPISYISI